MTPKPTKSLIKDIVQTIKKSKRKYLPVINLSKLMGLYPDIVMDALVYFDPMIRLDQSINTIDLLPAMEEYLLPTPENEDVPKPKRVVVTKKEVDEYSSIGDFVYRKFTNVGGLVERNVILNDGDLRILQKLVAAEVNARKPKKKGKKSKKSK